MADQRSAQYRRTHNLLLVSRVLGCRENVSPFTLILDSLEQSGEPVVKEMITRARAAKTSVIYVSFTTLRRPTSVDLFINAADLDLLKLQAMLLKFTASMSHALIAFDTLQPLVSDPSVHIPSYFAKLMSPAINLLATVHTDVPTSFAPYVPGAMALLRYLVTTILTVHSLHHVLSQQVARARAEPEIAFGMQGEAIEGVVTSLGCNDMKGVVIEMDFRRRSGRSVGEWFFLPAASLSLLVSLPPSPMTKTGHNAFKTSSAPGRNPERIILLEDHPLYAHDEPKDVHADGQDEVKSTFNLSLTEKQKRDREGVVLPYFDAQNEQGAGKGGIILYEMGAEDDFDEEEDEI